MNKKPPEPTSAMTSMFEQYNTTLKREEKLSSQVVSSNTLTTSSGYVSVRTKEETPIFSKQKMKINLPHDILFMRICNNWLVTLMSHQVLLRLYFLQPDRQDGESVKAYPFRFNSLTHFSDEFQRSSSRNTWTDCVCRTCSWIHSAIICWLRYQRKLLVCLPSYYTCIVVAINRRKLRDFETMKSQPSHSIQIINRTWRPARYWLEPAKDWYLKRNSALMARKWFRAIGNR